MTWLELASFLGLGVLSNTVFPMPFEPILVAFGGGRPDGQLALLCLLGSICAGAGALLDTGLLGLLRRKAQRHDGFALERHASARFYLLAAAAGLLPIPFTLVRAAILRTRPRPFLLAGIVVATRFPRYVATLYAWDALALPAWAGWLMVGLALLGTLEWRHASQKKHLHIGRTLAGGHP
jgi:membrane protein YqaA with SNARE-associated domain